MQYMSHMMIMSKFLQRPTTATNPKKKFPTLAEIKEEADPISDEVNLKKKIITSFNIVCRT
jgi:hypothetical protein